MFDALPPEYFMEAAAIVQEYDENNFLGHDSEIGVALLWGRAADNYTVQAHYSRATVNLSEYECQPCDGFGETTMETYTVDVLYAPINDDDYRVEVGAGLGLYEQEIWYATDIGFDGIDVNVPADATINGEFSGMAYRAVLSGQWKVTGNISLVAGLVYTSTTDRNLPLVRYAGDTLDQPGIYRTYEGRLGLRWRY